MAAKKFDFGTSISEDKPYIPFDAFSALKKDTLITGTVDYVSSIKGVTKAAVTINGSNTLVTLWDYTLDEARRLVGDSITLIYKGTNDAGYPKLYPRF